ncbi:hypothetical protein AJ79_01536 [Helicocarpus griseus UAMH5409]|uniref:Carrier domain-containing protein n=1 Tax=Helicocarpus griseus UAMH5409 TaxID=1447875 RepID=A0A2B7XXZ8_9EURO|nr:hypothetical protein AJ79_01536 [Helicocarpus griseus UAMH5409]
MVKATVPAPEPLKLTHEAAYVVVGGLGDLGKRVCLLLAKAGAGHIVTLSRTVPPDEALASFRQEIEGRGAILYTKPGDVADVSSVLTAPLELMTLDEYQTALKPKVDGTLNLQTAFASDSLDFFIMLSSSTGIICAKGQANYAAGNTFQDAFAGAQNARQRGRTRYVSLDIGAVAGSAHITRLHLQGGDLTQQSVIVMTFEEVEKLIEYAMGPQGVENDVSHCMSGFDRDTMITMQDITTLDNPMFALLPASDSQSSHAKASDDKHNSADPAKLLQAAKTLEEAEAIVLTATAEKFSIFLDREVPVDVPTMQLAIDSLVSIELKNWMSRTFQAAIQASEIAGALSITAIAKLLTSRSKLISEEVRKAQSSEIAIPAVNETNAEKHLNENSNGVETKPSHGHECCKHSETLLRQPLVDLDEALDNLIENFGHLHQPENFRRLEAAADELRQPGGKGQKVYNKLVARYNDPTLDSWNYDLVTDAVYLKRRYPLAPYASFVGSNFDPPTPHTQSERAAVITLAAFAFRDKVAANEVEPHWYYGKPTCTSQLKWLFDACREPGVSIDRMRRCLVTELEATLDAIIERVTDEGFWTGILTSDDRDSWAVLRAQALALNPRNLEYFKVIEESSFVVCLDDNMPETDSEQVRMACRQRQIQRHPRARRHRRLNLLALLRMDPKGYPRPPTLQHPSSKRVISSDRRAHPTPGIHLPFNTALDAHMSTIRTRYLAATSTAEYKNHTIRHFGTDDLMSWAVPVKSVLDITVQLALRIQYGGRHVPCWEGVSMSHYHKGRNDMLQVCSPAVVSFCAIADDNSIPLTERRARLLTLGRDMSANMQRCLAGKSPVRFMEIMRDQWNAADAEEEDGEMPVPVPLMFQGGNFWTEAFCILQHVPAEIAGSNMLHGVQRKDCFFISVTPYGNR